MPLEPQINADERRLNQITEAIIGAAYTISNELGVGFLEKVYENAIVIELLRRGLTVRQQEPVRVYYRGEVVGDYVADLLVEGEVLVELKAVQDLNDIHDAQCLNYLRATGKRICLLINFGKKKVEVRRLVHKF